MRKTYPAPEQRNLMLKLCKRKQGVTVREAKEQGVRNPTLQVQELRLRGFEIGDIREKGKDKRSTYKA